MKFFVLIFMGLLVGPATAATVTFVFEAEYGRTIGTPPPATVAELAAAFSTVHGTFSYDDATIDTNADPLISAFDNALITIDEFALPTADQSGVGVGNNYFSRDVMTVYYRTSDLSFRSFINFVDLTATAFTDDTLPTELKLNDFFDTAELGIYSNDGTDSGAVYFNLTSLERAENLAPVPLPSSSLLLLSGVFGALALKRFKKVAA